MTQAEEKLHEVAELLRRSREEANESAYIVKAHANEIRIESSVGSGTKVNFTIPIKQGY